MFPLHIRRVAFPALPRRQRAEEGNPTTEAPPPVARSTRPTRSQRSLIVRAINGWGDPEQLTDTEAAELKVLCARWFGLVAPQLQARAWRDAVVFSSRDRPGIEYAIIVQEDPPAGEEPFLLYQVNRGHRLVPASYLETRYLEHIISLAVEEDALAAA